MFFRRCSSVLLALVVAQFASAEEVSLAEVKPANLQLSPNKCVALRKGRECFASIEVKWTTVQAGNYCLRRQADNLMINCWFGQKKGEFLYVFRAAEKESLQLILKDSQRVISQAEVKVSWVYKSKRSKGRWRVF